jgi:hypothetical protein
MAFKLNSSSGEQRRLPDVDKDLLVLELSDYERIARDILKELKRSTEDLAVALKSKGLAVQLYNEMENDGAVAAHTNTAAAAAVAKPVAKRAAETSEKARSPDQKRSKSTKESPKVEKKKTASPKKAKKEAKSPKAEPKKEKTAATSTTGDDVSLDVTSIWIKSNPEFPPKSGKYPCYCKHKPLHHGYFTVSTGVVKTILADFVHGEVEMVNVDNPSQTWKAAYTVKDAVHRVPGDVSFF